MGSCFSAESRSPIPGSPSSPGLGIRKRKSSRKKLGSRNPSFDYRREEPLHRIPGRLFLNGSSEIASLFTQQGKKGTNQDAMIVWENFASRADTIFCGVFDGHGPYGHMVAKRVRDSLPLKLSSHWEVNITSEEVLREISINTAGSINSEDTSFVSADEEPRASADLEETEKFPEFFQTLKESFLKAFKVMDRELRMHATIDCFCSGTTAVTLIKQVLNCSFPEYFFFIKFYTEAERIRKCKGRVFALHDEPEVARVWLPNYDSPGLAMARAFGDFCLKDFGLISVPDISYRRLTDKDEFIVLATDGIWDVLSNEEVVDIVASAPARSSAARSLVESAVRAWRRKYPTSKVDDCAVVCLFLDSNSNTNGISTSSTFKMKEHLTSVEGVNIGTEKGDDPSGPASLPRSGTVRTTSDEEIHPEESEDDASKLDDSNTDWSALEGVSRVNTLLTLPRFTPGKDDRKAAGARK
ncbi:putative protein phosphatase 2C 33 [Citrus sinensis]|uniref:Uncharacterized protein n=1 Tax=Citrus sinensis TaxID=2711 RepID=A0ACB8JP84_CITSI|nr:putative protein phosphatase 2C 33 [Citrus sinensis]